MNNIFIYFITFYQAETDLLYKLVLFHVITLMLIVSFFIFLNLFTLSVFNFLVFNSHLQKFHKN